MFTNNEFKKVTENCLYNKGFKKAKKSIYYFETQDLFLCIIILRSNYSECYFLDYNFIIKAAHPDFSIISVTDKDFDFILEPRIKLKNGIVNLVPEELTMEYEIILSETIDSIIDEIKRLGSDYIKTILKKKEVNLGCDPKTILSNAAKKVIMQM